VVYVPPCGRSQRRWCSWCRPTAHFGDHFGYRRVDVATPQSFFSKPPACLLFVIIFSMFLLARSSGHPPGGLRTSLWYPGTPFKFINVSRTIGLLAVLLQCFRIIQCVAYSNYCHDASRSAGSSYIRRICPLQVVLGPPCGILKLRL